MKNKNRLLCLALLLISLGVKAQEATGMAANAVPVNNTPSQDVNGLGMGLTAFLVVIGVLIVLFVFFKLFTAVSLRSAALRTAKLNGGFMSSAKKEEVPGEVYAAISMALYDLSNDAHDIENTVLTIARTRRSYSPWSSKIYGLRETPNRR